MSKEVWFVSHYTMPPEMELRVKTLKYAEIMQNCGYKIKIFTASTIHNTNINLIDGKEKFVEKKYGELDFVHINVCSYTGNGLKRIKNLRQFSNRFYKIAQKFDKPYAIVADVNCVNFKGIVKFCKKFGVKFFSDIRDLWPLSIVEYLGFSNKNPLIKYLYGQEKKLYANSDGIIFSMEGGKQYIVDKGWQNDIDLNKVHNINNGVDIAEFEFNKNNFVLDDDDLHSDSFKIVYVGSIRTVNNIGLILDAAKLLQSENISLIIYGDGNEKESLEKRLIDENINNVKFKGRIDKKFIPYILSKADLNYINVEPTELTRKYGTSLNKLFDYMASGKPIVSNLNVNYNLVERYKCGFTTTNNTPEEMVEYILKVKAMPTEEYNILCDNSLNAAKEYDFKILTEKLISIIDCIQ